MGGDTNPRSRVNDWRGGFRFFAVEILHPLPVSVLIQARIGMPDGTNRFPASVTPALVRASTNAS